MIYCNGSPKNGTHLLLSSVRLFGGQCFLAQHKHEPSLSLNADDKHIHIARNPRNALISYMRMNNIELSVKNIINEIPRLIEEQSSYLHYLKDTKTLNIKFEKLVNSPGELNRISKYLDMPLMDDHFNLSKKGVATWTGRLSNWVELWNCRINSAWIVNGGHELEIELGYDL